MFNSLFIIVVFHLKEELISGSVISTNCRKFFIDMLSWQIVGIFRTFGLEPNFMPWNLKVTIILNVFPHFLKLTFKKRNAILLENHFLDTWAGANVSVCIAKHLINVGCLRLKG
jgi:hypothetical protein